MCSHDKGRRESIHAEPSLLRKETKRVNELVKFMLNRCIDQVPRENDECKSGYTVLDKAMHGTRDPAQYPSTEYLCRINSGKKKL